jgi:spermidine/putrescine transport system permease protein
MKKMMLRGLLAKDFNFFMASPAIVWHIIFFYVPVALIVLLSITKPGSPLATQLTLEHYQGVMAPLFFKVIFSSLVLALTTSLLCLLLAYPVAYMIAIRIQRYKNLFLYFLILPFWTSLMVQVYAWFFVLDHNGLINTMLMRMSLIEHPLHLLNTTFAIYIVMVYCYLPFMIMPIYTALEKLDRRMLEAAADLGATQWQAFVKVTLPLSLPGIKTGFFLVFIPCFGEFVVPVLLGGGKKLFVGSLITQYFLSARNPYLGSAFTIVSGIFLLAAVGVIYWYFARASTVKQKVKA